VSGVTGFDDRHVRIQFLERPVTGIEPKFGFARTGIWSMAAVATIRKQRPDLEIEIHPIDLGAMAKAGLEPEDQDHKPGDIYKNTRCHESNFNNRKPGLKANVKTHMDFIC